MSYASAVSLRPALRAAPPAFTVCVQGAPGAGKTSLVAALARALRARWRVGIVAPRKDAASLRHLAPVDPSWIATLEDGGLDALDDARPDLLLVESPEPRAPGAAMPKADVRVSIVSIEQSVALRPALLDAELFVVNKTDLAADCGVSTEAVARALRAARGDAPFFFAQCRSELGLTPVLEWLLCAYSVQSMSVAGIVR